MVREDLERENYPKNSAVLWSCSEKRQHKTLGKWSINKVADDFMVAPQYLFW